MNLGKVLRNARNNKGLTLVQAASQTQTSNPYLSLLERGKIKSPAAETLYRLCALYELPIDETFALTTNPK